MTKPDAVSVTTTFGLTMRTVSRPAVAELGDAGFRGHSARHIIAGDGRATRWAVVCFLMLLGAYASTLPHTLTDADAGEFLVIAKLGGVAHPPGYPLFVRASHALAQFDTALPLVTLVAAFSAVCVATAGALVVYALSRLIDGRAAACAVVLIFLSPAIWRQANAAEPFGLNLLLAASVIALGVHALRMTAAASSKERVTIAGAMGIVFGLGAANHHSLALLLPIPVAVAIHWWTHRTARGWPLTAICTGFFVGASPLLLLTTADHAAPLVYGDWSTDRLLSHLLRRDYGTFTLGAGQDSFGQSLWHFVRALPSQTAYIGPVLLLLGISGVRRWSVPVRVALLGSLLLAGSFLARMNISPEEEPVVLARFFALPMLLLVPLFAEGIAMLSSHRTLARPSFALLPVLLLVQGFSARRVSNRATEAVYEQHIRQMFAVVGREGTPVFVSASDLADYGLAYGAHVLGLAPNAFVVMLGPFRAPWYRARLASQLGIDGGISETGFVSLLEALNTRNILFVADPPQAPRPALFARARPLGGLFVVMPRDAEVPSWRDTFTANLQVLDETSIIPPTTRTTPLTGWEVRLLQQHRDALREVCAGLASEGATPEATACELRARDFDAAVSRLGMTRW